VNKLKTIGLIGGLTWESTVEYYKIINEITHRKLGERHSASMLIGSFDFNYINEMMSNGQWDEIAKEISIMAQKLERSGADCILICCNTLHKVANEVSKSLGKARLINIIDVIGEAIVQKQINKIGLLGSTFTMELPFYKEHLSYNFDIYSIIPSPTERTFIMNTIEKELGVGEINSESKDKFLEIINNLVEKGAEGIILGCTEIPLLLQQKDTLTPLFDSTYLHSQAAVEFSLK
jgi:aspartate racemase